VVHCYVEDITERLNLEAQLLQSQKMESIGQLAAGVAHDFNNMLSIIQGHAGLMAARPNVPREILESSQAICCRRPRQPHPATAVQPQERHAGQTAGPAGNGRSPGKMLRRMVGTIALEFVPPPALPPFTPTPA
jgi:signal transduction histidine kinase